MRSFNQLQTAFFLIGCLLISVSFNFYRQQDSLIENKNRCEVFTLIDHSVDQVTKPAISLQGQIHRSVLFFFRATHRFFLHAFSAVSQTEQQDFLATKRNFYSLSMAIQLRVIRI